MFGASKFNRVLKHPGFNDPVSGLISAGVGLLGASSSKKDQKKAAKTAADAQTEAARIAAEESRFRPIDMSNLFGNVSWTQDEDGRVSGVNLNPSDFVTGLFGDAGGTYGNYANLLSQYFQPDIYSGASQIYDEWQNLQAPTRTTQQTNLFDALQAKGITGIQGYDPLSGAAYNPMMNSLFSSWAGADQQMAAGSQQEYLNRLAQLMQGTDAARASLVGIGELPMSNVLNVSAGLGGRVANPTGADALFRGTAGAGTALSQGQLAGAANKASFWNSFTPQLTQGLEGLFGGGGGNVDMTGFQNTNYQAPSPFASSPSYSSPYTGGYNIGDTGLGASVSGLW